MDYRKGERVKHPKKPDWGVGQVLTDSSGGSVKIFFTHAGETSPPPRLPDRSGDRLRMQHYRIRTNEYPPHQFHTNDHRGRPRSIDPRRTKQIDATRRATSPSHQLHTIFTRWTTLLW